MNLGWREKIDDPFKVIKDGDVRSSAAAIKGKFEIEHALTTCVLQPNGKQLREVKQNLIHFQNIRHEKYFCNFFKSVELFLKIAFTTLSRHNKTLRWTEDTKILRMGQKIQVLGA